jgi:hypothetical protein
VFTSVCVCGDRRSRRVSGAAGGWRRCVAVSAPGCDKNSLILIPCNSGLPVPRSPLRSRCYTCTRHTQVRAGTQHTQLADTRTCRHAPHRPHAHTTQGAPPHDCPTSKEHVCPHLETRPQLAPAAPRLARLGQQQRRRPKTRITWAPPPKTNSELWEARSKGGW